MAKKHMIVITNNSLWKQIKIAAAMDGVGTSHWIEVAIKEKLKALSKDINVFLTTDFDDEVKL